MKSKGVSVLLNTKVTDISVERDFFRLIAFCENQEIEISTRYLVLAVGRLGQALLMSFARKVNIFSQEYHLDIGVRLEFPTELCPHIDRFHKDLKLLFGDARTFCLCKEGKIAPYRHKNIFLLEGFCDNIQKTGFTNLAITVRLDTSSENEAVFNETKERVLRISGGLPVRQMLPGYLDMKSRFEDLPSSIAFWRWGNINKCFPAEISKKLQAAIRHFVSKFLHKDQWWKISVFAPEADLRLRFPTKSDFSFIPRVYLAGDCTGRFRGILQAFCSGVICGENIIGGCP